MNDNQIKDLLKSGKSLNSIFTILGKALSRGDIDWIISKYPNLDSREALFLYVNSLSSSPNCKNPECSNKTKFIGYSRGFRTFCSKSCSQKISRNDEAIKQTMLNRYGVDSPLKLQHSIENQKESMKKFRGSHRSEDSILKTKQTNLEKYGFENASSSLIVREKVSSTMTKRYGGQYISMFGNEYKSKLWKEEKTKILLSNFQIALIDDVKSSKERILANCCLCNKTYYVDISNGKVSRCPDCFFKPANRSSKEKELSEWVKNLGFRVETNVKSKELIYPYTLDIWIPEKRIAIEFNGDYWHSSYHVDSNYHEKKTNLCLAKHINLIHIFEHEYDNKRSIVESRLKYILGLYSKRLYGRNCIVKVVDEIEAQNFINANSLFDDIGSYLGLYYNDELVGLMVYVDTNIIGICFKQGYSIVGGFSKLVSNIKSPIMNHNRRLGKTLVYERLGLKNIGYIRPQPFYVKNGNKTFEIFDSGKDILKYV